MKPKLTIFSGKCVLYERSHLNARSPRYWVQLPAKTTIFRNWKSPNKYGVKKQMFGRNENVQIMKCYRFKGNFSTVHDEKCN